MNTISITYTSPLQDSGDYYLNNEEFDSQVFFTSSLYSKYFFIICEKQTSNVWEVKYNGKLNGFVENGTYNYRFDFNNYIKINQERNPTFLHLQQYLYKYNGLNSSKLAIIMNPSYEILVQYASQFTQNSVGQIFLTGTPTDFVYPNDILEYHFCDKVDYNQVILPTANKVKFEDYTAFTVYSGGTVNIELSGHLNYNITGLTTQAGYDYTTYLWYTKYADQIVNLNITNSGVTTNQILPVDTTCSHNYFFYNINGGLDTLYAQGNKHIVNNVQKENVRVGDKMFNTKFIINNQIKQNIGYRLTQEQIYSFIKTPFCFEELPIVDENTDLEFKRWMIENSNFEGYVGSKLSQKNIELLLTDEKQYKRKSNFKLTFFD